MIAVSLMQRSLAFASKQGLRGHATSAAFMQPVNLLTRRVPAASLRLSPTLGRSLRQGQGVMVNPQMTASKEKSAVNTYLEEAGIAYVERSDARLRFAPSPTGSLHVGGARTALYNYLAAAKFGGKFVLRIEDTDVARSTKESEESMIADLRWLGLDWEEGPFVDGPGAPYRQSERGDIYIALAKKLVELGHAYPCFCTEEELEAKRAAAEESGSPVAYDGTWRDADPEEVQRRIDAGEPYTYRFKVPPGKVVAIDDLVRGVVRWDVEATLGDFILLRSTGVPVYNFCVAVDDALMGITTVARAEEHLTNTVRQVLVLEALGFHVPQYAHCSLILGEDRSKLSKRHGATSCNQFREQGYLPEAMINYLALLGWNDGTDKDVYTREELIAAFDLSRVTPSPAMFDVTKLKWLNGQHLRAMDPAKFEPMVSELLVKNKVVSKDDAALTKHITKMVQEKCELVNDALDIAKTVMGYQLEEVLDNKDSELYLSDDFPAFAQAVADSVAKGELPIDKAGSDEYENAFKDWVNGLGKATERKGKRLFMPLRIALTGNQAGPAVEDQMKTLFLAEKASAAGLVPLDERMKRLTQWVADHADDLARKEQAKNAAGGTGYLADNEVGGACMVAVAKLAPQQQRTILSLAQQLLESHPPDGSAPAAGNQPKVVAGKGGETRTLDRSGNVEPVSRLDLRVGKIISCEKHPDADALYVEQIDVGDPEGPRTVISGLANFIPIDEMVGRTVAVVCNLKPAKMRGIESFGMVLCGSDEAKTKVELLEPAEGSVPGERLALESMGVLQPSEDDKVLKSKSQQKVWGIVAPDMKTDSDGCATYRGSKFSTSKGPLRCKTLTQSNLG
eukprot:CAMPEP_0173399430 /NCGR_PEP_ID=MMETSP1356-20130122/44890_1 /TAXON_ID=77927 ORGANISM="Hemiselmis virescens, Strain PCC157" /NCGR_SAMPLE_ID=MMETSP1356 /ASSEMBLY_ACC=CAM_ASM_000847 /LENGTH=849 /DNA_ID=CAMNT_0014359143 /DNA_START=55 /DNA_END=2604 /DNA_ORIENTATION=+